jgi:hypothetical protein
VRVALVVTVGLALLAGLWPTPADAVEGAYATGVYPVLQRTLTPLTNITPVAMLDVILITIVVVVPTALFVAVRNGRRDRTARPVLRTVGWIVVGGASSYLVFLALWGLNYRRVPMEQRIELARPAPARDQVLRMGMTAARALNALYADARQEGWLANEWRDDTLRLAFREVQLSLSDAPPAVPGRLKDTVLGTFFRWAGVDGMVNPFGLEVLANPDLLPFERPFVAAHEWAHLAGYADESEASFVAWLVCLRASRAAQYSGWLYLFWQINGEVDAEARAALREVLTQGPRRDIDAVVERLRRGQLPLLRSASWRIYDQYLKANRVAEGVESYGAMVALVTRARFDDDWLPVRREQP